jgi:transcription antitermination protein NusB
MLNRRFIRIKIMQALYAWYSSSDNDLQKSEKEIITNFNKVYELYLYLLSFFQELYHVAKQGDEDLQNRKIKSADTSAKKSLTEIPFLAAISDDQELKKQLANYKISWQNDMDAVKQIYKEIKTNDAFKRYEKGDVEAKTILLIILTDYLANKDLIQSLLEEKFIHWADDMYIAASGVSKTIEAFQENNIDLQGLWKDKIDDEKFARELFVKCILNNTFYEEMVSGKTKNWELERIALLDVILMKMALCEIHEFPTVPIKVSMNEYIDISKEYSTPKSKQFINGILDKIVIERKNSNLITKTGRGLIE